jgi:sulfite reductase beta subunit-like hemoprotein
VTCRAPFAGKKQFFSAEKNQKTFAFNAILQLTAMARTVVQAQGQKSFGSFLQKRTSFLLTASVPAGEIQKKPARRLAFSVERYPDAKDFPSRRWPVVRS